MLAFRESALTACVAAATFADVATANQEGV